MHKNNVSRSPKPRNNSLTPIDSTDARQVEIIKDGHEEALRREELWRNKGLTMLASGDPDERWLGTMMIGLIDDHVVNYRFGKDGKRTGKKSSDFERLMFKYIYRYLPGPGEHRFTLRYAKSGRKQEEKIRDCYLKLFSYGYSENDIELIMHYINDGYIDKFSDFVNKDSRLVDMCDELFEMAETNDNQSPKKARSIKKRKERLIEEGLL
ncbi:hypothetical protein J2T55_000798 [Methylohalomonas lacus]|uniref:Uncharacterized protein n=1 Tax=Methylohalomonas lacus TaxID=398773 RepID=A0AAE3HI90_9GAMM|nr:hypothetical protein [Methylohalomonas lacus]MCS3902794.1 hypothetical protein [Methylohalomonas lacus]